MSSHTASIDHGDPGPVYRDCLALGVKLNTSSGLCGVLDNTNVTFVRALEVKNNGLNVQEYGKCYLGDLDCLAYKLLVSTKTTSTPASPTAAFNNNNNNNNKQ